MTKQLFLITPPSGTPILTYSEPANLQYEVGDHVHSLGDPQFDQLRGPGCFGKGGVTTKWRKMPDGRWKKWGYRISECCDGCISFSQCFDKFKREHPADAADVDRPEEEPTY